MERNMVGWFEIPVKDMGRAIKFYQDVMDVELSRNQMGPLDMAFFPWAENEPGAAGSLVYHEEYYQPSTDGVLVYLSSKTGDLNDELNRVEAAGGKVLQPKTLIKDDIGYMALFLDSEGNRVAFHSRN